MRIVDIILEYDTEASIIDWINSNYDTFTQTVNVCDKHRFSPLQYACRYNYTDVVNLLIKENANINYSNFGIRPIHYALENDNINIFKILINAGAETDIEDNKSNTILHYVACGGNIEMARYLIERHLDVIDNINQGDSHTPLTLALESGNVDVAKLFIKAGANVNVVDDDGEQAPLNIAVEQGYIDIVKLLIKRNVDLYYEKYDGETALDIAINKCKSKNNIKIIKLLLNALMYDT